LLGDHSVQGYEQRARFYGISNHARLLFAQRIAGYILFLAESTDMTDAAKAKEVRERLASFKTYDELLADIG
jgi:hypothetical protein